MKKLFLIISLLIALVLLSACATSINTTPTPFAEIIPTSTSTSFPPTATIEPSPTVDPNMPEGATGKDANGNYTKTENGLIVVWNKDLNTWEQHLNLNDQDIPLVVWGLDQPNLPKQVFLTVRISDRVQGFEKIGSISLHPGANVDNELPGHGINFPNQFVSDVIKKYAGSLNTIDSRWFTDGKISFSFTTNERPDASNPWVWKLGPNTSIAVDILDAPIGNGFFKRTLGVYDGIDGPDQTKYQVRVFSDDQGNLHEWIVPGKPLDQLTKEQLLEIYLYAPAYLTQFSDFRTGQFCEHLTNYIQLLTKPAYPPFIDFGPSQ